tara:strand:- start:423 stop:716 length:294 start_codon:yes stop_codon:yes gene_type:complete
VFRNNLTKIDLINKLSIVTGYSKIFSGKLINDIIEIILLNIKSDNFQLKNIGSFKLIFKKERIGRNPKTKEEFIITPRKQISFTPSKKIIKNLDKLT